MELNFQNAEADLQKIRQKQEEQFIKYLSEKQGLPSVSARGIVVEPDALQLIPEKKARKAKAAAFKKLRNNLHIAVQDPSNETLKEIVEDLKKQKIESVLYVTSEDSLIRLWDYYKDIVFTEKTEEGKITINGERLQTIIEKKMSLIEAKKLLEDLGKMPESERLSKNIEHILATSLALKASDVHIEKVAGGGVLRYRLDGLLVEVHTLSETDARLVTTRLKLVSGMKINITNEAQDGSFSVSLPERDISVRTSTIPGEKGGSFVLRILDPKDVLVDLGSLGIHQSVYELLLVEIRKPNGMILTTGPTGSGKTTTLYSFLNAIKSTESKIITLEDPIEYRIEGLVQTEVSKDYSFAGGLRAILRQDPDVLLVGEIRDPEVAEVAINASLTGHMVFSTLHTNDAAGSLPRLVRLGVSPNTFSQALTVVMAQRLLRKLCPHCCKQDFLSEEQKEALQVAYENMPTAYKDKPLVFENIKTPSEESDSCRHCFSGYSGRTGIYEIFKMSNDLEKVMNAGGNSGEIRATIKKQDLPFMADDALWKVSRGITSLEEAHRVLGIRI